jgi:hypothetical protein
MKMVKVTALLIGMIIMLSIPYYIKTMTKESLYAVCGSLKNFNIDLRKSSKYYWDSVPSWVKYSIGGFLVGGYLIWNGYKKSTEINRINILVDGLNGQVTNLNAQLANLGIQVTNLDGRVSHIVSGDINETIIKEVSRPITEIHTEVAFRWKRKADIMNDVLELYYERMIAYDKDLNFLWNYIFPQSVEQEYDEKYEKEKKSKQKEKQNEAGKSVQRRIYPKDENKTIIDLIKRFQIIKIKSMKQLSEEMNDSIDDYALVSPRSNAQGRFAKEGVTVVEM